MVNVTLTARLEDINGNPVAGRTIDFYVDGSYVGSGVTGSDGVASVTVDVAAGVHTFEARFSGDDVYDPSSANVTYNVEATGGGSTSTTAKAGVGSGIILLLLGFILLVSRRKRR